MDPTQHSYDEVPYESHSFPQTHPDRLAVIGTLFGLEPRDVTRCRVLEIGCAAGGNLIPLALGLPESRFVGLDLSAVQIQQGRDAVQALGLTNIELRHCSVMDFPGDDPLASGASAHEGAREGARGKAGRDRASLDAGPAAHVFDYIICHGVYSWVRADVQARILEICGKHLAPQGIAYVSYNTYPGWHVRGMIREMLCYHAKSCQGPALQVKQARNLLDFIAKASEHEETPYGLLLKAELEWFHDKSDSYLYHEVFEDFNAPLYFYQFAERAAAHGLKYVADAELRLLAPGSFPPEIENGLRTLAQDNIHLEQYLDFLRNRRFRQSLLCHQNLEPKYAERGDEVARFYVASAAKPKSGQPVLVGDAAEEFVTPDGVTLQARAPIVKAAMVHLAQTWPRPIAFAELLRAARAPVGAEANDEVALGQALLMFYASAVNSLVELWQHAPRFAAAVPSKPVANPLARYQAAHQELVTSYRHETGQLGPFERHLIGLLDGTRDHEELVTLMHALIAQGELTLMKRGQPVPDAEQREILRRAVKGQLASFCRSALLMAS